MEKEENTTPKKRRVYVLDDKDVIQNNSLKYFKTRVFKASIETYTGKKIEDSEIRQFMSYINGIEKPNKSPNDINVRIAKIHKYIIGQYDNYNYVSNLVKKINL